MAGDGSSAGPEVGRRARGSEGWGLGLGLLAGTALASAGTSGLVERWPALVLLGWLGAGLCWVAALNRVRAGVVEVSSRAVIGGALALRLVAFVGDPGFSDDVHRYVWEGELVRRGLDPYAVAPSDPRLAEVARALPRTHARLNHPEVPAAYPPVAQYANALGVTLGRTLGGSLDEAARRGVRALYAGCDLLVLVPLAWLLRRAGRSRAHLVAWAWCPLVAVELGGAGHFDALGILLLCSALALATPRRPLFAAGRTRDAAVGLAVLGALTKLLPIGLVPFLVRGPGARRRIALAALVLVAAVAPIGLLEPRGPSAVDGLATYAFRWESTSLVHRFVERAFTGLFELDEGPTDPRRLARALAAAAWIGALAWLWRRRADPLRAARVSIAAFLVFTPTLHPWYVTWIVPFLALERSRAFAYLVVVIPLAYAPLAAYRIDGRWIEPAWLWPVLAVPFFTLLGLDAFGRSIPRPWKR